MSLYAHLLTTNDLPSPTEQEGIKSYIQEVDARLPKIDAKIKQAAALLKSMLSHRSKLEDEKTKYLGVLSCLRRVPPEVLAEIISCSQIHNTAAPAILSLVSRTWRAAALSSPRLWSSLIIGGKWPDSEARKWIKRSGTVPLHVKLDLRNQSHCIDILASCADRVESLDIELYSRRRFAFVAKIPADSFGALRHLSMSIGSDTSGSRYIIRVAAFETAPQLTSVSLTSISNSRFSSNIDLPTLRLPWFQLTHLTLTIPQLQPVLDILRQCRWKLTSLILVQHAIEPFHLPSPTEPIRMESLTIMSVSNYSNHFDLFDYLKTPVLESLLCRGRGGGVQGWHLPLLSLTRCSACPLKQFQILDLNLMGDTAVNILLLTPSLTHLSINTMDEFNMPPRQLRERIDLRALDENEEMLPHLERLVLTIESAADLNYDSLRRVLLSRCPSIEALAVSSSGTDSILSVEIISKEKLTEAVNSLFYTLELAGLPITWKDGVVSTRNSVVESFD